jgi:RNA polymerase sigma-70 factor (ECF subfamily)
VTPVLDPNSVGDHLDRLFRAAYALTGNPQDADDLVQDMYVRVLSRPRWLRKDDDLGYLLRALRNTFLTRRRDASRRIQAAALPDDLDIVEDTASPDPMQAFAAKEVYAAIAELPDDYRETIVLVDVAGLSYQEAATVLGVKIGTVMSRLSRARGRVADAVGEV